MTKPDPMGAVLATRHYKPLGTMLLASNSLREIAAGETPGRYWAGVAAVVMLAFSVEAFCNQYGPALFPEDWVQLERKSILEKLRKIARKGGVAVDVSRSPWLDIKALIAARDSLAHPKPSEESRQLSMRLSAIQNTLAAGREFNKFPWEIMAEPEIADALEQAVRRAFAQIMKGLGINEWDVESMGGGGYSVSSERV